MDNHTFGNTKADKILIEILNSRDGKSRKIGNLITSYHKTMKSINEVSDINTKSLLVELTWKEWIKRIKELNETKLVETLIISVIKAYKRTFLLNLKLEKINK